MPRAAAANKRIIGLIDELESPGLRAVHTRMVDMGVSTLHTVAATAILRAFKILSARLEAALAEFDLNMARYDMLGLLDTAESGRMSLSELSRSTLLHPATTTYTVDSLEKRGWIVRRPDPNDRRVVLAEITSAGRRVVRDVIPILDQMKFGLTEVSEDDAHDIAVLLSHLRPQ